jgi:hypothetical protein
MMGFLDVLTGVPGSEFCSKGSPITTMGVVKRKSRFDLMPARNLRIVKRELGLMRGICEACNKQFRSHIHAPTQAEWEIKILFERHNCKTLAERLGIMRGSREG